MTLAQEKSGDGSGTDRDEDASLVPSPAEISSQHENNGNLKFIHRDVSKTNGNSHVMNADDKTSRLSVSDVKDNDEDEATGPGKVNFITGFRRKLKTDAVYVGNLKHSLCLATALFTLGLLEAQSGPTFLDLQIITGTDVSQASFFFTSHSIGYLLGSMTSGYVSGTKLNASLVLMMTLLAYGGAAIGLPYCSPFVAMVAIRGITGVFGGIIGTSASAEHMRIWGKDGPVLMQLLHFCFAVGGVVSPLISEPFLAEKMDDQKTAVSLETNSSLPTESISATDNGSQSTNVHWAFLITGLATIFASIPFVFLYKKSKHLKQEMNSKHGNKPREHHGSTRVPKGYHRKTPKSSYIALVVGLCAFLGVYCCVESSFASFLMTFVVRRFRSVSKSEGAHITAVYWASFAASRFLMIFVSRALSPVRVLYVGGSLMVVAFTGFTLSSGPWAGGGSGGGGGGPIVPSYTNSSGAGLAASSTTTDEVDGGSVPALTFFTALAALAMSGVFPAGLSWSGAELVKVTGRVSSLVYVSASLVCMLNPLLVSRLMQSFTNLWFCYVLLLEVLALALVFCSVLTFNRCVVDKRYGKLHVAGGQVLEVAVVADRDASTDDVRGGDDDADNDVGGDADNDVDGDDDDEEEDVMLVAMMRSPTC